MRTEAAFALLLLGSVGQKSERATREGVLTRTPKTRTIFVENTYPRIEDAVTDTTEAATRLEALSPQVNTR